MFFFCGVTNNVRVFVQSNPADTKHKKWTIFKIAVGTTQTRKIFLLLSLILYTFCTPRKKSSVWHPKNLLWGDPKEEPFFLPVALSKYYIK